MTVLSGARIKARLASKNLDKRLVVSPILEPDEQLKLDQGSIDIRLGSEFALVFPSAFEAVDELAQQGEAFLKRLYRKVYVPLGEPFVIHPHQFILAQALEYLRLPRDLMSYVVGRSTWGRLGLTVATAIGIHPGFAGTLTLELRNLGETPLTLRPGQTIAQLFFHSVETGRRAGYSGQYRGSVDMIPKRMSSERTREKLRTLRDRRVEPALPVVSLPIKRDVQG